MFGCYQLDVQDGISFKRIAIDLSYVKLFILINVRDENMYKGMLKVTSIIIATGFIVACGGGGGGGGNDNDNGTPNVSYNGDWGGVCEYDADFNEADFFTLTIDGTKATIDFKTYPTSDCSGSASETGEIVYSLDFVGTQNPSTSVCEVDDLVNTEIVSAKYNGNSLTDSQLDLIRNAGADEGGFPAYSLFCINPLGDTIYFFDVNSGNGATEATRPTLIDDTESVNRI